MTTFSDNHQYDNPGLQFLETVLNQMPAAYAEVTGGSGNETLEGMVRFYPVGAGVLVNAEIYGLPNDPSVCGSNIHGFHIHEGNSCTGNSQDPFANSGMHYNPRHCPHPAHAGDMPPLFSNNGFAWMMYFTDRFRISDVIGKTVIVHEKPDDFVTQPSGNSGNKIGCGIIQMA